MSKYFVSAFGMFCTWASVMLLVSGCGHEYEQPSPYRRTETSETEYSLTRTESLRLLDATAHDIRRDIKCIHNSMWDTDTRSRILTNLAEELSQVYLARRQIAADMARREDQERYAATLKAESHSPSPCEIEAMSKETRDRLRVEFFKPASSHRR